MSDHGEGAWHKLRIELRDLKAENVRLRRLRAEDRQFADDRVELAVAVAKSVDQASLEAQIVELQKTIAREAAVIDRVVVYLRKRG